MKEDIYGVNYGKIAQKDVLMFKQHEKGVIRI